MVLKVLLNLISSKFKFDKILSIFGAAGDFPYI